MTVRKTWRNTAVWLGIAWSLLWSIILVNVPLVQKLELDIQDNLTRSGNSSNPPNEILLIKIKEEDLKKWKAPQEPIFYADLVKRLLEEDAAVVVLNLLPNWIETADRINNPISQLVRQHYAKVVLVLPTTSLSQLNPTEWRTYKSFIPFDDRGEHLIRPREVLGFSEYEPEAKNPVSLSSSARQAYLSGKFFLSDDFDGIEIDSAAWLAYQKFQQQQRKKTNLLSKKNQHPLQIYFWGPTGTFTELDIDLQSFSKRTHSLKQVRNKILFLGFVDRNNPDSFSIESPFKDNMPALELQANITANLLTKSLYRVIPWYWSSVVIAVGGIAIGQIIVLGMFESGSRRRWYWLILSTSGIILYLSGLNLICFANKLIVPIALPILSWSAGAVSIIISMFLGVQKKLIHQQNCEIARLRSIEQEAIISQSRKLLHRLASNIHDDPLQEFKTILDSLEIFQLTKPSLNLDPILDQLEQMGHHLRQHLIQTRTIALELTPELRDGLDVGINKKLQDLVNSGKLTLKVLLSLQPIEEPKLNSFWLEAREDIYRFFCEAIANIINHAQPPNGNATQVRVSLSQQLAQCTLIIENDGDRMSNSALEIPLRKRKYGGYGTKLMETIASELPGGSIERLTLAEGGMRVKLTWNFNNKIFKSNEVINSAN
jgi:signal transduction histidine kinase